MCLYLLPKSYFVCKNGVVQEVDFTETVIVLSIITHRNLSSLLPRVLVVRFPSNVMKRSHLHSLIPAVWGFPLPTPVHCLTTVFPFLRFSPRERALSRLSIDSFPTCCIRLTAWCNFHLARLKKSI